MSTMSKRKSDAGRRSSLVMLAESAVVIDDQREAREQLQVARRKIEAQLEADEQKLANVRETKLKGQEISNKMEAILNSFNERLERLQQTIGPLHQETMVLTQKQTNLGKVDAQLNDVLKYYSTPDKLAKIIDAGPSINLEAFIDSIDELRRAMDYFEDTNNTTSPEFTKLTKMYNKSMRALESEFENLLEEHSEPLSAEELLNYSAHDLHEYNGILPPVVVKSLRAIFAYMGREGVTKDLIRAWAKIRGSKLLGGLEASVQRPVPATPQIQTTASRRLLRSRPKSMRKSRGAPPDSVPRTKRQSFGNMDLMMQTKTPKKAERNMSMEDTFDTESLAPVYEKGTHPFMRYCEALLRAMIREHGLMRFMLQGTDMESLEDSLANAMFKQVSESWVSQSEVFYASSDQRNLIGPSGLFVLDVVLFFHAKGSELEALLARSNRDTYMRLHQVALSFADLGRKQLLAFLDATQGDGLEKVPLNGTVHQHTTNTLTYISSLHEYDEIAGSLLHSEGFTNSGSSELRLCSRNTASDSMSAWLNGVLGVLCDNMSRKARSFEDVTLQAVFLMNNFDYILRYLATSPYIETIRIKDSEIESRFSERVANERKRYQGETWGKILTFLKVEDHHRGEIAPGSLNKKEREVIKDKYSRFNEEFEAVLAKQFQYAIPNPDLRAIVDEDNKQCLIPTFTNFDRTYRKSGFSQKNPQKYLKYSAEELVMKLSNLFSGS